MTEAIAKIFRIVRCYLSHDVKFIGYVGEDVDRLSRAFYCPRCREVRWF